MLRAAFRVVRCLARREINTIASGNICRRYCALPRIFYGCDIRAHSIHRQFSFNSEASATVDPLTFDHVCSETLESLCDYFEELTEKASHLKGADVTYGDGVLTVKFGAPYGTYVINRQTPNKQIWLSSPTSGPKRYDLVLDNGGHWIYKHDGFSLHQLLQKEIPEIVKFDTDFGHCAHGLV